MHREEFRIAMIYKCSLRTLLNISFVDFGSIMGGMLFEWADFALKNSPLYIIELIFYEKFFAFSIFEFSQVS